VVTKNSRTKESFTLEWQIFNYEKDRTWDADAQGMLSRFCEETDQSLPSIKNKIILDAGCGNGLLDRLLVENGATVFAMDLSLSIERAMEKNRAPSLYFLQGDVQFPPLEKHYFDIVHCSGVLIHTNDTEQAFNCMDQYVKHGGKLSAWLYHPRKNLFHNAIRHLRRLTSRLPLRFQYYLYVTTIFPLVYLTKKLKGNKQNAREMMIDIMDSLSPEFRWQHTHEEVEGWYRKRNYTDVKITTTNIFGFNITGIKK
jgi:SAM-dependent methyltransferase